MTKSYGPEMGLLGRVQTFSTEPNYKFIIIVITCKLESRIMIDEDQNTTLRRYQANPISYFGK